jgi:hypothetical protein
LRSLFPNIASLFLYLLLGLGFTNLFKISPNDKIFWILLIIYIPLPIYFIIIKPYIESKIHITRIELNENQDEVKIDYLKFKFKKQITIGIQDFKYNIFNQVKISLADRIAFYDGENKLLTQYSNSNWSIDKLNEVVQFLEKSGIKKPYGYNK